MLISRAELRLAVAAGLSNGFAAMTGLAYGFYSPLAVVSVGTGSYGGAIELGRQRLLGTALGSVLLLVGYWGLRDIPMPIAIAITLAALRLLGGWLKLLVGYKVGGLIVVMGWLSHSANLGTWIPCAFLDGLWRAGGPAELALVLADPQPRYRPAAVRRAVQRPEADLPEPGPAPAEQPSARARP